MQQLLTDQPIIEATRFVLRPPRKSDAGLIAMYASDERVARDSRAIPHPLPPGAIEAMIDRALTPERTEDTYVIDGSASGHAEAHFGIQVTQQKRSARSLRQTPQKRSGFSRKVSRIIRAQHGS